VTPSRLPRRAHHRDPRPGPQALGDLDQLGRAGGGVDAAGDDRLRRRARLGGVHRRPRDALTQSLCSPDSTMTTGAPVDTRRAPMPSYILMRDGICSQHDPWTYGTSPPAARQRDREGGADRHCAGAHGPRRRDSPRPGSGLTEEHRVRAGGNRASLTPDPGRHARDPERAGPVAHIGDAYDNDALEAECTCARR